jgi:hypothetical protein
LKRYQGTILSGGHIARRNSDAKIKRIYKKTKKIREVFAKKMDLEPKRIKRIKKVLHFWVFF